MHCTNEVSVYSYTTEDIPGVMDKLDQCRERINERCDTYFEDIKPLVVKVSNVN